MTACGNVPGVDGGTGTFLMTCQSANTDGTHCLSACGWRCPGFLMLSASALYIGNLLWEQFMCGNSLCTANIGMQDTDLWTLTGKRFPEQIPNWVWGHAVRFRVITVDMVPLMSLTTTVCLSCRGNGRFRRGEASQRPSLGPVTMPET